ncbi:MAG: tRNA (adenosine(37)-N6)-dimethylallyltransferase MiaA [Sphingomonadaceae bacterium]
MIDSQNRPSVALIAGPTASGKSAIALALAKLTPATIINADASQVYRDLRIISARPSPADEAQARHQLFGYIDGAEACSAARWAQDAIAAIEDAREAGQLPILVGGTGLYITTLLDGIAPVPDIDPAIRATVRAMDVAQAYACLSTEDPPSAARLAPADSTRVARALEVVRSTGRPIKAWQAERVGGIADRINLCPLILRPPRDWLLERCDARFDAMIEQGAVDEVRALLARSLDPQLPVMRAIGVREIAAIIADPARAVEHEAAAKLATRQFAKRQYTWFANQPPKHWPRFEGVIDVNMINDLAIKLRDRALTVQFVASNGPPLDKYSHAQQ